MVRFYTKRTRFTDKPTKGMRGGEGSSVTANVLKLDSGESRAPPIPTPRFGFLVGFFFLVTSLN